MATDKLTEQKFWEDYWATRNKEVAEIKRTRAAVNVNYILDVFDQYLTADKNLSVLEIGGAPGQYLIYFYKTFNYKISSLDYSRIGNEQTKKNLAGAHIPVEVYEKDLFTNDVAKSMPQFDVVYSLGFIEHFEDTELVVKKHVELLKPGGILIVGVPNLRGIYKTFLQRTAPQHLAIHNLKAMDINNWQKFDKNLNLTCLYKSYVGGFQPLVMKKIEKKSIPNMFLNFIVKGLLLITMCFPFIKKLNSRYWSGYLIGVYRKNQ